ncbi:MAG: class I SAM-dependent methyltransferase [Thermodesulfobacteriota bacterium]
MDSFFRRTLKFIHPEGIPWPGSLLYNWLSRTNVFQEHYDLLARDILAHCSKGRLLDVGTGPGWLLLKLHGLGPELRLTGLDVSPAMVNRARKNVSQAGLSKEIEIITGEAGKIPRGDSTFEAVVSTGAIHHWKQPIEGLNEIYRVLKPGGQALIYDIVSDTPAEVKQEGVRMFGRLRSRMLWLHALEEPFYGLEEYQKLGRASLFQQSRIRFVGVLGCLGMIR